MRNRLLITACWVITFSAYAQIDYPTGISFNDDEYNSIPIQALQLRGGNLILPESSTLKQFCPKPTSQRQDLISPSSAAAYSALTMLEASYRGISNDPLRISRELSYSPVYNYFLTKPDGSEGCQVPTSMEDVLQSMKEDGTPLYRDFFSLCPSSIPESVSLKAQENKISDYFRLFHHDAENELKIEKIKLSVSQEAPVIIVMHTPPSFYRAKDFWQPRERFDEKFPLHAMVVVGYDDKKYGGAFEVMNSWGTDWGNDGFMWIKYDDLAEFVRFGYELFLINGKSQNEVDMIGNISIPVWLPEENIFDHQGNTMPVNLMGNGYYKASTVYPYRTQVRIRITSLQRSFIYVFSSDESEGFYGLFPDPESEEVLSAALPFKENILELPLTEEDVYSLEDESIKKNYLAIIFSKEELWLKSIEDQFNQLKGQEFKDKVSSIFKDQLVKPENIVFDLEAMKFSGKSEGKTILPIIIEVQQDQN